MCCYQQRSWLHQRAGGGLAAGCPGTQQSWAWHWPHKGAAGRSSHRIRCSAACAQGGRGDRLASCGPKLMHAGCKALKQGPALDAAWYTHSCSRERASRLWHQAAGMVPRRPVEATRLRASLRRQRFNAAAGLRAVAAAGWVRDQAKQRPRTSSSAAARTGWQAGCRRARGCQRCRAAPSWARPPPPARLAGRRGRRGCCSPAGASAPAVQQTGGRLTQVCIKEPSAPNPIPAQGGSGPHRKGGVRSRQSPIEAVAVKLQHGQLGAVCHVGQRPRQPVPRQDPARRAVPRPIQAPRWRAPTYPQPKAASSSRSSQCSRDAQADSSGRQQQLTWFRGRGMRRTRQAAWRPLPQWTGAGGRARGSRVPKTGAARAGRAPAAALPSRRAAGARGCGR